MMKQIAALALALAVTGCGATQAAVIPRAAGPVAAAAKAPSATTVKTFVRAWFALLDRNAPTESYLPLLDDEGLNMAFPERTLRSHADFKDWYGGILKSVAKARHTLRTVDVTRTGPGAYDVHVIVLWEATMADGKEVSFLADQAWKVHAVAGQLRISEYLVSAAQ